MKFRFTSVPAVAALAAALLGLTACGTDAASTTEGTESTGSADSSEITVYNAQHESMTQAWVDQFTEETGIKVTLRKGSDTEMSNQILAEGDKSPADVFITENSPAMTQVANAGLFSDISDTVKEQVPEQFRPSSDKWTGVAARSTVFVYNKDMLTEDQLPESIMDLAKPEWKGKWGASPSGADFQAIVSAMLELEGEDATREWLEGMKENSTAYKGNSAVLKAVNAGEIPAGVIYHYYYFGDQAKTGENSGNVVQHYFKNQDPGAFVSVSGAGVLKSSDQQEAAQKFLEFITSEQGQQTLSEGSDWEYPVGKDVQPREGLVPLDELEAPEIDPAKLNSEKVAELMTSAGLI